LGKAYTYLRTSVKRRREESESSGECSKEAKNATPVSADNALKPLHEVPSLSTIRLWRHQGTPESVGLLVNALETHPGDLALHLHGIHQLSEVCLDPDPELVWEAGGVSTCLRALRKWPGDPTIAWKAAAVLQAVASQSLAACNQLLPEIPLLVRALKLAHDPHMELSKSFELQWRAIGALLELATAGDGVGPQAVAALLAAPEFQSLLRRCSASLPFDSRQGLLQDVCSRLGQAMALPLESTK